MKRLFLAFIATVLALIFIDGSSSAGGSGWFTDQGYFQISKVCRDGYLFSRASSTVAEGIGGGNYNTIKTFGHWSRGLITEELKPEWFDENGVITNDELILESDYYPFLGPTVFIEDDQIIEVKDFIILGNSNDKFLAQNVQAYFFKQLDVGDQVQFYKTILPVEDCFLATINGNEESAIQKERLDIPNTGIPDNNLVYTVLELPTNGLKIGNSSLTIGSKFNFAEIAEAGLAYSPGSEMQNNVEYFRYSVKGTTRVSVNSEGEQAEGGNSSEPSISADGIKIAFTTEATNLASGIFDDNEVSDVILRTHRTFNKNDNQTDLLSRRLNNIGSTGPSFAPQISPDGATIAFVSTGEHLLLNEGQCTNLLNNKGVSDIFLYRYGTVSRLSMFHITVPGPCQPFNQQSNRPSLADSTYGSGKLIFETSEPLELPFYDDGNSETDLLLNRSLSSPAHNEPIYGINNLDFAPGPGVTPTLDMPNGRSYSPQISADGNVVAFQSDATDLIRTFSGNPADTNGVSDIYASEWTGTRWAVSRISVSSEGAQTTGGGSGTPAISQFGQHIAFMSFAGNLDERFNSQLHIYVRDRQAGCTTLLSVNNNGQIGSSSSLDPSISANGRFVAFYSFASNLVKGDTNDASDIFVVDRDADNDGEFYTDPENCVVGPSNIIRVSVASDGTQANEASFEPDISANGAFVAFSSDSTNLVENDTNGSRDVFVHYLGFEGKIRFKASENTVVYLPLIGR